HKEGTYVLELIDGGGELMKEIDRRLKVSDLIIRHLVVRIDEEQLVIDRTRSKRTEASRRRRVARGLPPDRQPGEGQRGDTEDDDRFDLAEGERGTGREASEAVAAGRREHRAGSRGRTGSVVRCSAGARSASSARTRS